MEVKTGICRVCGKEFSYIAKSNRRLYCSPECIRKWKTMTAREARGRGAKKGVGIGRDYDHKKAKSNRKEIAKINILAQAEGMSYGKYLAEKPAPHFNRETRRWE